MEITDSRFISKQFLKQLLHFNADMQTTTALDLVKLVDLLEHAYSNYHNCEIPYTV